MVAYYATYNLTSGIEYLVYGRTGNSQNSFCIIAQHLMYVFSLETSYIYMLYILECEKSVEIMT